jgi:hypothetical protein
VSQSGVTCRIHGCAPNNVGTVSLYVELQTQARYRNDDARVMAKTSP